VKREGRGWRENPNGTQSFIQFFSISFLNHIPKALGYQAFSQSLSQSFNLIFKGISKGSSGKNQSFFSVFF